MILSVHILRSRKQLPRLVSFPFFSVPCCLLVSFPSLSFSPLRRRSSGSHMLEYSRSRLAAAAWARERGHISLLRCIVQDFLLSRVGDTWKGKKSGPERLCQSRDVGSLSPPTTTADARLTSHKGKIILFNNDEAYTWRTIHKRERDSLFFSRVAWRMEWEGRTFKPMTNGKWKTSESSWESVGEKDEANRINQRPKRQNTDK